MWKNVHPVSGTGIRTYNLLDASTLPQPLDQGSHAGLDSVILYSIKQPCSIIPCSYAVGIKMCWTWSPILL